MTGSIRRQRLLAANRRQAAGFRQGPGTPRSLHRLGMSGPGTGAMTMMGTVMMRMPPDSPLSPEKDCPAEYRQGYHQQRADVDDDLSNGGPRGDQRANRVLFADAECPGQKTDIRCHRTISLFTGTFLLSSVALVSRRDTHQDRASRLIFNNLEFGAAPGFGRQQCWHTAPASRNDEKRDALTPGPGGFSSDKSPV
jgi:hypothetical protein